MMSKLRVHILCHKALWVFVVRMVRDEKLYHALCVDYLPGIDTIYRKTYPVSISNKSVRHFHEGWAKGRIKESSEIAASGTSNSHL